MSSIVISGDTSGTITLAAPAIAGSNTLTLPLATDTLAGISATQTLTNKTLTAPVLSGSLTGTYTLAGTPTISSPSISSAVMTTMASSVITSGTAQATTSGTFKDFTSIPSWVKRITVMLSGVSTNGASNPMIQLGTSGGVTATGYVSSGSNQVNNVTPQGATLTTGFLFGEISSAAAVLSGIYIIANVSGNIWVGSFCGRYDAGKTCVGGGAVTLGSILTQVRLTTVNGTDTFDAGSVNILYE